MLRGPHKRLLVFGCLGVLLCLCGVSAADESGLCNSEGISVEDGIRDEKLIVIRYAGQAITTGWGTRLLDTKTIRDRKGNSFLFLKLTEGGSCGDGGLLVTASEGRLLTYSFGEGHEGPCGGWEVVEPDKVVFRTVWMDICALGWCHACGPSYPIIWTIDDCRNGKIIARRSKGLREVYSDKDGKVRVKNMLKDLRQRIVRADGEKPVSALSNPLEKEFCTRVAKGDEGDRTVELLFYADFSIGDRFYFFSETQGTGAPKKQRKR